MYKKKLTGEELILAVEELKEFSKTEVIFQCGYYELDDFGTETVDIESFDYALKEAYADRIINPKKRKIPAPYRYQKKDVKIPEKLITRKLFEIIQKNIIQI